MSHATIGDSFTGGGLSFLRTASLSDSGWSRISAGCLARGFGLSAGAEVAGSASLTRSHAVLRIQPAHLSAAVQIPTFFGRPLRLAGKAGAERPSPGEMSCPRPNRQRQGNPKVTEGLGKIGSQLLKIGGFLPITFHRVPDFADELHVRICVFLSFFRPLPGGRSFYVPWIAM